MGTRKRSEQFRKQEEKKQKRESREIEKATQEALRTIHYVAPVVTTVCRDFAQGLRWGFSYSVYEAGAECDLYPFPNRPLEDQTSLRVVLSIERYGHAPRIEIHKNKEGFLITLSPFSGDSYFWRDCPWTLKSFLSKLLAHSMIVRFSTRYTVKSRLESGLRNAARWILEEYPSRK